MKKTLLTVLAAFLLAAGCAEDNPFVADPDAGWSSSPDHPKLAAYGTLSGGLGNYGFQDMDPQLEGIQDGIMLLFDEPLDPATVTDEAFALTTTFPIPGPVEITSVLYFAGEHTAVLRGTFAEETAYLLTIPAGTLTDLDGRELDPNHNGLFDGAPLDDQRATLHTGSAEMADIVSPAVTASWPQVGGVESMQPEIAIVFGNGPMDTEQLNLDNFTLVRTSDLEPVAMRITVLESDKLYCVPAEPLEHGTRYTVTMAAGITDAAGNPFDTNNDGWIWPDEADRTWDFQTADDGTTHATPPTVESATLDGDVIIVEFAQSLTGRGVVMDPSTFVAANIQCIDDAGGIPLSFQPRLGGGGVVCFLHRGIEGLVTVHVSCNVADQYGNLLDGNNDGLGGTPGVDDWAGAPGD